MLSPESCGAVCPVAAIFCGTSGYACKIKSKEEATEPGIAKTLRYFGQYVLYHCTTKKVILAFFIFNIEVATDEGSGADGDDAAEPAEGAEEDAEEEESGELAEKRSGIQEDVISQIRLDSE